MHAGSLESTKDLLELHEAIAHLLELHEAIVHLKLILRDRFVRNRGEWFGLRFAWRNPENMFLAKTTVILL